MRVTLPAGVRRAEVRSFGVALAAMLLLILAYALGLSGLFACTAALLVAMTIAGICRPRLLEVPYRVWNRAARVYAHCATLCVSALCFYVIVCVVGSTSSSWRRIARIPSQSTWNSRQKLPAGAYESQHGLAESIPASSSWTSAFVSWCRRTGNEWALCLLPFVMLLSSLESDSPARQPSDLYTLF